MKLSNIITPEKFRQLATYIDKKLGLTETGTEVQDDLRKFADALEQMEAENISSNPVLGEGFDYGHICLNTNDGKCTFRPYPTLLCSLCGRTGGINITYEKKDEEWIRAVIKTFA